MGPKRIELYEALADRAETLIAALQEAFGRLPAKVLRACEKLEETLLELHD